MNERGKDAEAQLRQRCGSSRKGRRRRGGGGTLFFSRVPGLGQGR